MNTGYSENVYFVCLIWFVIYWDLDTDSKWGIQNTGEGQNRIKYGSYGPILLLNSHINILAKALAGI